jgi:flavin-dependent dehydrogenase
MPDRVDVLIVGAGPAGLSAGIVLAQHGLRTLVCEQQSFPVDKACGEGVMPTGLVHLERLGVKQHLAANAIHPFVGIRYHSPRGRVAAARFAEGPGWGIRRTNLSAALLRRAHELDHLEVREAARVERIERAAQHISVQIGGERILTRLLIGADGLNSRVRRWAGLERRLRSHQRWGVRQHFAIAPWSEYVEVHWADGVEAYVTPCGDEQVGIAFLWDRTRFDAIRGGAALFASLMQSFPKLRVRLDGAPACDTPRAIGPLHRSAASPVGDGVLLIGDAAGYLDAITGEGISLATAQALCLENTVVPILRSRDSLPGVRDLAPYARAYRSIVTPYYQMTRLVLCLSRHATLAEAMIGLLARPSGLFQSMLSANMGLASPWARLRLVGFTLQFK